MRSPLAITFVLLLTFLVGTAPSQAAHSPAMSCLPPYLKLTFERMEDKFGDAEVVSTNRPGARVAGTRRISKHASCRAIDFNPPNGKHKQVLNWLKENHEGGVGTYSCGMRHIHIDNGEERHWHTCAGGHRRHHASRKARHRNYASRSHRNRGHATSRSSRSRQYASRSNRHERKASRSWKRYASR